MTVFNYPRRVGSRTPSSEDCISLVLYYARTELTMAEDSPHTTRHKNFPTVASAFRLDIASTNDGIVFDHGEAKNIEITSSLIQKLKEAYL